MPEHMNDLDEVGPIRDTPTEFEDDDKEMTLEEFMVILRQDVDRFEKQYKDGQTSQPDTFPITMGVADWAEQFSAGYLFDV